MVEDEEPIMAAMKRNGYKPNKAKEGIWCPAADTVVAESALSTALQKPGLRHGKKERTG